MKIPFTGLTLTRTKHVPTSYSTTSGRGGWWPIVRESFAGAWQRNIETTFEDVLTYSAVYACVSLIASDIGKLRIKLIKETDDDIWEELPRKTFSPFAGVLNKPNRYQTRIKFLEQWVTSKLINGNAYILKERDNRGVVRAWYVLDPTRVRPLVAPDGSVFYALSSDNLAGIPNGSEAVPASEIIHDVMVTLYHPLCGVSPLTACGMGAIQGLRIQHNSANFFGNGSTPGGLLIAPGTLTPEEADNLQKLWEANYGGDNAGRVAVLGNGLKYEAMAVNATDSQLIEQLRWTAENVCSAFHVPAYKIGVGNAPTYNNVEALGVEYYSQCLQTHIESIELLMDEGLDLPNDLGVELDLDGLMRMDTSSKVQAAKESMNGGGMTANEARKRFHGLGPVDGGDSVLAQQQNYSLAALAKRDARPDPFSTASASPDAPAKPVADEMPADADKQIGAFLRKALAA